ncbi:hypothetical protein F5877DRAFT_71834 [Lentinula edodes]|nr:hypothetical protein F5877DRAFT_71834 [Lentinula edodes]
MLRTLVANPARIYMVTWLILRGSSFFTLRSLYARTEAQLLVDIDLEHPVDASSDGWSDEDVSKEQPIEDLPPYVPSAETIPPCNGIRDTLITGSTDPRHAAAWSKWVGRGQVRKWVVFVHLVKSVDSGMSSMLRISTEIFRLKSTKMHAAAVVGMLIGGGLDFVGGSESKDNLLAVDVGTIANDADTNIATDANNEQVEDCDDDENKEVISDYDGNIQQNVDMSMKKPKNQQKSNRTTTTCNEIILCSLDILKKIPDETHLGALLLPPTPTTNQQESLLPPHQVPLPNNDNHKDELHPAVVAAVQNPLNNANLTPDLPTDQDYRHITIRVGPDQTDFVFVEGLSMLFDPV